MSGNGSAASCASRPFRTFLIVWAGQLASSLGNGMTAFALAVHIYRETQAAAAVAMVMLCLFLPAILLRPLGGVLADRYDRRILIVLGDLGSATGVLFILVSALADVLVPWRIYLGVAFSSLFVALQNPAYKAAVTDLLPPEHYSRASGLVQLASSAQHLISPMVAGVLLGAAGLVPVLLLDLSTFVVAVVAALAIGRPLVPSRHTTGSGNVDDTSSAGTIGQLMEGWKAVHTHKQVFTVLVLMSLTTLFLGVLQTLFAPMMLAIADEKTLGFVQSISASGMLISSLILGAVGISRRHDVLLVSALIPAGLFLASIGVTDRIGIITASFFLFFCTLPVINTCADVLIRTRIPNRIQGRAWGIIGLVSQLGFVLAYVFAGFLADRVFTPLMMDGGGLARSVGGVIGTGEGRGMALMLVISGVGLVTVTMLSMNSLVTNSLVTKVPNSLVTDGQVPGTQEAIQQ